MKQTPATKLECIPEPENHETLEVLGDGYQIRKDVAAGSFAFLTNQGDEIAAIDYICPCGCGAHGCLPIKQDVTNGAWWRWNGDTENPTLEPSILRKAGCRWHGYLRNGVWEEC